MRKSHIRKFATNVLLACMALTAAMAQQVPTGKLIEGYSGNVQIIPNATLKTTTIVLAMPYKSTIASSQIVFHLQQYSKRMPYFWTGTARILSGHGTLAVIPEDGSQPTLFIFKKMAEPDSLKSFDFDTHTIFGIGYFGENTALTNLQIQQLANLGYISANSDAYSPDTLNLTPQTTTKLTAQPNHTGPTNCVAGSLKRRSVRRVAAR